MIESLAECGYDGVVFSPEPRDGKWQTTYDAQVGWEKKHLELADVILAWVPRHLKDMPAFTTNVEFGKYVGSGKLLYGRPDEAPKNSYLDWMYRDHGGDPYSFEITIADAAVKRLGDGAERTGGEREVPYHVWKTDMFQKWYASQKAQGNRLDGAKVLWNFTISKFNVLFAYSLWVNVWVKAEDRNKTNEFVLARNDISVIIPFWKPKTGDVLDTRIVLVREFRSPVRNSEAMTLELPGGSSFKGGDSLKIVADELQEETGLAIPSERFFQVQSRQLASTWSSHHAMLFGVQLTDDEIVKAEEMARNNKTFGVADDTELTYVSVMTLRELLLTDLMDWSMIGMVANALWKQVP
jgi:8-oxo-dGTP pyrophosphatase MutT (NUDIX family)